jgi:DNA-directed RNA polymerase subunit RPC12/RpoP
MTFCSKCHHRVMLPKGFGNIQAGTIIINCPNCQAKVKIKGTKTESTPPEPIQPPANCAYSPVSIESKD